MQHLLQPRSLALVGVSSKPNTLSAVLLNNLKRGGFTGKVYLVNPKAEQIGGLPCCAQVRDLPREVDLALLMVPARGAEQALRECAERGVHGVVVISAGFRETGGEGAERERRLVAVAREAGIRLIGPNSMGLMNLAEGVNLNGTFSPADAPPGKAAFITQSGALGVAILSIANLWRLGISQFVSLGNEADVTATELIEYCVEDRSTRVILVYLESLEHGEELLAAGRRLGGRKPLVLLHAGRTEAGAAAAASHTGAMATRPGIAEGIFQRAGFLVPRSLEELLEMGVAFSLGRVPQGPGRSIAVLTNAGGPAVLATDVAVSCGLSLAALSSQTRAEISQLVPDAASLRNPVDLLPAATDELYLACAERLLADSAVEQLLVLKVNPPLGSSGPGLLDQLAQLQEKHGKTVLASLLMPRTNPEWTAPPALPRFWFPEASARAAAALARFSAIQRSRCAAARVAERPAWLPSLDQARGLFLKLRTSEAKLPIDELFALLDAYGISSPPCTITTDCRQAAAFAERCGYPVAIKTANPEIIHKTEAGGVWLDIRDAKTLCSAFAAIPASREHGVLVQKFVKGCHREVLAGFLRDARLGPLLAFGLGGTAVEALGQISYLALPASSDDLRDLIASVPASELLGAFRGRPPVDFARLVQVLLALAYLGLDHPEIVTVEINPLLAGVEGEETLAVDARISVSDE
jgi:acetyltransferase